MNWMIIVGVFFIIGGIGNIPENIETTIFAFVVGVALLYLGVRKMGVIPRKTAQTGNRSGKASQASGGSDEIVKESFFVVGTRYYKENIGKLACRNEEWKYTATQAIANGKLGEAIYRYTYINKPVKLVPEPKNEHDKNAVAVYIAGELVGYIGRGSNLRVKEILNKHKVEYISASVGGGQCKIAQEDKTFQRHEDDEISIRIWIGYKN